MNVILIPEDKVEKIRAMKFDGFNRLDPIIGEFNGQKVYFLQAEIADNPIFTKVLDDFKACEIKDIENFETKYLDADKKEIVPVLVKGVEVFKDKNGFLIDLSTSSIKTVLTEKTVLTDKIITKL